MRKVSVLGISLLVVGLVVGILGVIGVCSSVINNNLSVEAWPYMIAFFCGGLLAAQSYLAMKY